VTRGLLILLVVAAAGLLLAILGWILEPALFPHAWLSAAFVALGWPLGSIALLMIHAVTGGRWAEPVRGPLLLGVVTLPLILAAFIPVGFVFPALYPWVHHDVAEKLYNTWYLNVPFLAGRSAVYVVVWLALAVVTVLGGLGREVLLRRAAPPGLILMAVTVTFAAIDFSASLDPEFNSSVWGMLTGTGMVLLAFAIALLFAVPAAEGRVRDDLGKLLLALCVLWAYFDFVQMLIIWSSNLKHDAPWIERRFEGFWGWAFAVIALLHAVGALLLLAVPRFRRSDAVVMGLAGALIVAHVVRSWWLVLPEAHRFPGWLDVVCMLGLLAFLLGAGLLASRMRVLARVQAHV
jgi:hypothetical protein